MPKTKSEADLITEACDGRKLREAAAWLNENLPLAYKVSHMSIKNWQDNCYKMSDVTVDALMRFYPVKDLRYQLAAELLTMREEERGLVEVEA
jgi:hypothetical protein